MGAVLLTIGLALKILALTPIAPTLGAVSFLATIGAFPPALLITCAIVTTIGMGLLVSYLIEKHAV